jgi:hypothetical protein
MPKLRRRNARSVAREAQSQVNDVDDFRAHLRNERRRRLAAVREFAAAVVCGDIPSFAEALVTINVVGAIKPGFRAIRNLRAAPQELQHWILDRWIEDGDGIRDSVNDDAVLMDALRVLLPPYRGAEVTLFRGSSAWNRRGRSYGLSWSTRQDVARRFAEGIWQTFERGSVLLKTIAPPRASICEALRHAGDRFAEAEYLVDRRHLYSIEVLGRFARRHLEPLPTVYV